MAERTDMTDPIEAAEKRGYARGYKAGRKRQEKDQLKSERLARREEFRRQVFLASVSGFITSANWQTGEKRWSSYEDYARGVWQFADEALKGARL